LEVYDARASVKDKQGILAIKQDAPGRGEIAHDQAGSPIVSGDGRGVRGFEIVDVAALCGSEASKGSKKQGIATRHDDLSSS
jgi:hypothetical protein